MDFKGDKAHRPNGLPMAFFQDLLGHNQNRSSGFTFFFFFLLLDNAQFDKSLNATFISLIPKKSYAMEVRDFRPVSLIGGCTKLLLKF